MKSRSVAVRLGFGVLALSLLACGDKEKVVSLQVKLAADRVAEVGNRAILSSLLVRVARATQKDMDLALSGLVADTLLALEAERSLPSSMVKAIQRATFARALLEQIKVQEEVKAPILEEDAARVLAANWAEVDRPASVRVAHAVVLVESLQQEASARMLAETIRSATASAATAEDFQRQARAVPNAGLSVRVESLPPVTADGRSMPRRPAKNGSSGPERFDPEFARAANALTRVGEASDVVRSAFGYHVIYLEERVPAQQLAGVERDVWIRQTLTLERTAPRVAALLTALRQQRPVQIERSAADLTRQLIVEP